MYNNGDSLDSHGRKKKAHTQFINQPDLCPSSYGQTPNDPTWSTLFMDPTTQWRSRVKVLQV